MKQVNILRETTSVKRLPLNREQIVLAAVDIADREGIEGLSMRKLGQVFGVEAMALYHHFAGKEALIDSMVDSVHAEIEVPQDAGDWSAAMRKRAVSAVKAITKHPWAAPLMETRKNPGVASMRLIDGTVGCLRGAGFSLGVVAHTISLLDAYTFGFAQQLRPTVTVEQSAQMGIDIMKNFPFDRYPHAGEFISEHVVYRGYRTIDEFYYGLDLILAGIARDAQTSTSQAK